MTDDQRARAKAVNVGSSYGASAGGRAQQRGSAAGEAQETIDAYFERYEGVRRFLDETTAQAKTDGFVRTWMGRRRYLPDLTSRNRVLRPAAPRVGASRLPRTGRRRPIHVRTKPSFFACSLVSSRKRRTPA